MIDVRDLHRALAQAGEVRSVRALIDVVGCYDIDVVTGGQLQLLHVCGEGWAWPTVLYAGGRFVEDTIELLAAISASRDTATIARCEFRGASEVDWTQPLGPKQPAHRCTRPGLLIDENVGTGRERRRAICLEHGAEAEFAVREHPHASINGWPNADR